MAFRPMLRRGKADLADWDYVGRWGTGSEVEAILSDEETPAWRCRAAAKGRRVGKAYLTKNIPAVTRGQIVEARATYLIQEAPSNGSLYLMDFECRNCGPRTKAGIRVMLRNGQIRVNRSKLGLSDDFVSRPLAELRTGEPFTLTVRLKLGAEEGGTMVLVNDKPVLDRRGVNMPLKKFARQLNVELKQEQIDYVQLGITANSGPSTARVLVSDVAIQTFK